MVTGTRQASARRLNPGTSALQNIRVQKNPMHTSPYRGKRMHGMGWVVILVDGQCERGCGRRGFRGSAGSGYGEGVAAGSGSGLA